MTQAKITAPGGFKCAPAGHTVETFQQGAIVTGKVAEWALAAHRAQRMFDPRSDTQAHTAAPETKAIPDGWRDLSWPKMRSLAASLTDDPIRDKDDAIRAIEGAAK